MKQCFMSSYRLWPCIYLDVTEMLLYGILSHHRLSLYSWTFSSFYYFTVKSLQGDFEVSSHILRKTKRISFFKSTGGDVYNMYAGTCIYGVFRYWHHHCWWGPIATLIWNSYGRCDWMCEVKQLNCDPCFSIGIANNTRIPVTWHVVKRTRLTAQPMHQPATQ